METVGSNNNFGKQTQDLADKAAEESSERHSNCQRYQQPSGR